MRINKIITINIDVKNPIEFCTDKENKIKEILVTRYVGKCYAECYIVEIHKIHNMSDVIISYEGSVTYGKFNIIFEVIADIYPSGSILLLKAFKKLDTGIIWCKSEGIYSVVSLGNDKQFASLKQDQIMPITVTRAAYKIHANSVNILGNIYMYPKSTTYYTITDGKLDKSIFAHALQRIESANDEAKKLDKERISFFRDLMYPYKTAKSKPSGVSEFDLVKIATSGDLTLGTYSKDITIPQNSPIIYKYNGEQSDAVTTMTGNEVILYLLEQHANFLELINGMAKIYEGEVFKEHANLWKIYATNKMA